MLHCKECGSSRIGWDAWVDQNDELIASFDHYKCLGCDTEEPELVENWFVFSGSWIVC